MADLIGRDQELRQLRGLIDQVVAWRGASMWVEGEPGIGKTALLDAALTETRLASAACQVYIGLADEFSARFPLRVLLEALQVNTFSTDPDRAQIAVLLRDDAFADVLAPADLTAALAERLIVLVEQLCADSPVLLILDDMQWADDASLAVWGRLHKLIEQLPLLLVAACRPVPRRPEVAALRRAVTADHAAVIKLVGLSEPSMIQLLAELIGASPGPHLLRHAAEAAGNPLYLREMTDALNREGLLHTDGKNIELTNTGRAPVSLTDAITGRLGFLTEQTARALQMAALLGPTFSVIDLASITGETPSRLTEVVSQALAAGILCEAGDGLGFRHGLIRQALYDAMPASVRAALHRQAAQVLAEGGAPPDQIAGQLLAAPYLTDGWTADWISNNASALVYRAPAIAVELLERVRVDSTTTLTATTAAERKRHALNANLATALLLLGRDSEVEPVARSVLVQSTDPAAVGLAAWTLTFALLRAERDDDARAVSRQVTEGGILAGSVWTGRIRALESAAVLRSGAYEEAEAIALDAEAEGQRAKDALAVGHSLLAQSAVRFRRRLDPQGALEAVDRALSVVEQRPETTDLRLQLLCSRAGLLSSLVRPTEAGQTLGAALALAEQWGSSPRLGSLRMQAADHYFNVGKWDDAIVELAAAADLIASAPARIVWRHGLAALMAGHRDDMQGALDHLTALAHLDIVASDLRYFGDYAVTARAVVAERTGDPRLALAELLTLNDPRTGIDITDLANLADETAEWLPFMVRLALSVDDRALAEGATEVATARGHAARTPRSAAVPDHCLGLLSRDPDLVLAAADLYHDSGLALHHGLALENAAVILAELGDLRRARQSYADAIALYDGLRAAWDIRRADTRMRPHGVRRGQHGRRSQRPTTGWDALTPTEYRVAILVAAGRTNPDIAAEMWLSRATVQTHVSHILAKLGAHSRVDIAREAGAHQERR